MADKPLGWLSRLQEIERTNPRMYAKLLRYLMTFMSKNSLISLEDIEREISTSTGLSPDALDPNRPAPRAERGELEALNRCIIENAQRLLNEEEINGILHASHKNELAIEIGRLADDTGTPFSVVVEKLQHFRDLFREDETLETADIIGTRVALIRRFLTDQLEFINIAKDYIRIPDLADIVERIIVPGEGNGKVGGKASGLILAWHILQNAHRKGRLKALPRMPRAWHIRSDGILHFIAHNNLEECTNIKYRDPSEIQAEYFILEKIFKSAQFPPRLIEGLTRVLEDFPDKPIIVRSSSLLEDRAGTAFSGKYKSLFVANRGTLAHRLDELTNAVAEVYASTFSPDAIIYRREKGLLDFQEEMGILIQEVVGNPVGPYFLPSYAGVAFTNNEIRWSPRIGRKDGVARIVAGLGTRAVDRVYDDYAYLMSPGKPNLKTGVRPEDVARYSQRLIDVINIEKGFFETIPIRDLFQDYLDIYPNIRDVISIDRGSGFSPPVGILLNEDPDNMAVTFDGLISKGSFPRLMKSILDFLTEAYERPVDIEFAADAAGLYLLQCRTQTEASASGHVAIPGGIPLSDQIFSAVRFVPNGKVDDIEYVVYIDVADYEAVEDYDTLVAVGKCVGHLNRLLPRRRFILMGPGRWGSRGDIKLGVRVTYMDINNTSVLIEVAKRKGSYLPEVSFGTHFFQDLVEAGIRYLPLYPDDADVVFNEDFLHRSPNCLAEIAPEYQSLEGIVRVLRVENISAGRTLQLAMDGDSDRALAWLDARTP